MSSNDANNNKVRCPHCGAESREKKLYAYGSPFVKCHKCKAEYYDGRFHEIALSGIREGDMTTMREAVNIIVVGAIIAGVSFGFAWLTSMLLGRIWIIAIMGVIFGVIALVYGIIKTISVATGAEQRKWDRLTLESQQRVGDLSYMMRLKEFDHQ